MAPRFKRQVGCETEDQDSASSSSTVRHVSYCGCAKRKRGVPVRDHPPPSSRRLLHILCDRTTQSDLAGDEAGRTPCARSYGHLICDTSSSDQSELSNRQFEDERVHWACRVLPTYGLRKQAWLLKNSFQSVSTTNFVRKLLSLRSLEGLKFTEITAFVPFSTATGVIATLRLLFARQAKRKRKLVLSRFIIDHEATCRVQRHSH